MSFLKRFKIVNDLKQLVVSSANVFHFLVSAAIAALWSFWGAWGIGIAWDIGDGFKERYYNAPDEVKQAKFPSWNWFIKEFWYSNKCSLQDILVWDLGGCAFGLLFRMLIVK